MCVGGGVITSTQRHYQKLAGFVLFRFVSFRFNLFRCGFIYFLFAWFALNLFRFDLFCLVSVCFDLFCFFPFRFSFVSHFTGTQTLSILMSSIGNGKSLSKCTSPTEDAYF